MGIVVPYDPGTVGAVLGLLTKSPTVLLYIGPDQIMPLTSVLGAIVGVALMFWNRLLNLAHRCRALFGRSALPRPSESSDSEIVER